MDLRSWLKMKKTTIVDFAKMVGVSKNSIQNYLNGRRTPRLEIATRIEVLTEGKVTIHDLMQNWEQKNS